jgi:hypothetical protein
MNKTVKKKRKFDKSSQKQRIISLMHSSILRRIWINFMAQYFCLGSFTVFAFAFPDFQIFRHEYYWRDLIGRNAHLVHGNWYHISFPCCWVSSRVNKRDRNLGVANFRNRLIIVFFLFRRSWHRKYFECNVLQLYKNHNYYFWDYLPREDPV